MKNCATNPVVILASAGNRNRTSGALNNQGSNGNYWSSSPSGTNASNLNFNSTAVNPANTNNRANGFSVRCVQDSHSHSVRTDGNPGLLLDIFRAYFDARKNKRSTVNALAFEKNYEEKLFTLYEDILHRRYAIGRSVCFIVDKPVKREIFAADFRDRVVHHLLFNWLNPIFEPHFIGDSYSCRKGKGTFAGIKRLGHFIRSCSENHIKDCWVLKLDIRGYFMSMDRAILHTKIERKLRALKNSPFDIDTALYLLDLVVSNDPTKNFVMRGKREDWDGLPKSKSLFYTPPGKGFPIGNLTSQLFSNIYLDEFDHFVREKLDMHRYGRYVDDMVFVHSDKKALKSLIQKVRDYLWNELGLELHPKKTHIQEAKKGVGFLGTFLMPWRTYIGKRTKRNFYARTQEWNAAAKSNGGLGEEWIAGFTASMNSYLGILRHYDTFRLRNRFAKLINGEILRDVVFSDGLVKISAKPKEKVSRVGAFVRVGKAVAIAVVILASTVAVAAHPAFATAPYISTGTVTSANLLVGRSASTISNFYYDLSSLPGDSSATIQFSQDGTNWYSSANVLNGSDTLSTLDGANISLATLSWTGSFFYYRITMNATSDLTQSPILNGIRLDYTPDTGYGNMLAVDSSTGNVSIGGGAGGSQLSVLGGGTFGANYLSNKTTNGILVEGWVGVGTTSPSSQLTLDGAGNGKFFEALNSSVAPDKGGLTFSRYSDSNGGTAVGLGNNYYFTNTGELARQDVTNSGWQMELNNRASGNYYRLNYVAVNGTASNFLTVNSAGNMGVGTTSPYSRLSVWGAGTDATSLFELTNSASTTLASVLNDGTFYMKGNVGIGTTTPSQKLTINGNGYLENQGQMRFGELRANGAEYASLSATSSMAADVNWTLPAADGTNGQVLATNGVGNMYWATATGEAGLIGGALTKGYMIVGDDSGLSQATSTMFLSSTGNLGIGTTEPDAKLEISGGNLKITGIGENGGYIDLSSGGTSPGSYQIGKSGSVDGAVYIPWLNVSNLYLNNTGRFYLDGGTDTYITNVENDAIDFVTGDGTVLKINDSGKIGIGTTTPNWLLHVSGTRPSFALSDYSASANLKHWLFSSMGGNLYIGTSTDAYATSTSAALTVLSNGNVGIGTSVPEYKLDVAGSARLGSGDEVMRISSIGNVGIGTTSPYSLLSISNSATTAVNTPLFTIASTTAGTATSTLLTVLANGNVGIGTTEMSLYNSVAGTTKLAITGSSASTNIGGNTDASISIINTDDTANNTAGLHFAWQDTDGTPNYAGASIVARLGTKVAGQYPAGALAFLTSSITNGAPSEKLRITESGYVGIGTTSPATLLEVGGSTANVTFDGYKNCTAITSNANGLLGCTASDERVKQNIISLDVTSGLSAINALNPVSFNWKDTSLGTAEQFGLIAQEVEVVFPNLVQTTNPTEFTPEGTLTINYYGLIAPIIKSIQELDARTRWMETATSTEGMPSAVLTADGKGVDIYKLATYNLSAVETLSDKVDAHEVRLTSLETRVDALESGAVSSSSGTSTFSTTSLASAFEGFGVLIKKGIAQFNTLVFRQLVASKDADGTSSAGSISILTGNTVAQVNNSLVMPSTKVFITFNSQIAGSWWVSDKAIGSFRVILSEVQPVDVSFDYFLVQTEGQMATSTPDGSFITSPSVSQSNGPDTEAPVITLLGDNPVHISIGGAFIDPGVQVTDNADGTDPIVTYINGIQQEVNANTIDASSQTTYIITYTAADRAGNNATPVTRSVIVGSTSLTTGDNPAPDESQDSDASGGSDVSSDTTSPVVTLVGDAAIEIIVDDAFTDPGATAADDTDPSTELGASGTDITASIVVTGSVDTAVAGLYTLTYTATDTAGNVGTVSRLITVIEPVAPATPVEPVVESTPLTPTE